MGINTRRKKTMIAESLERCRETNQSTLSGQIPATGGEKDRLQAS